MIPKTVLKVIVGKLTAGMITRGQNKVYSCCLNLMDKRANDWLVFGTSTLTVSEHPTACYAYHYRH